MNKAQYLNDIDSLDTFVYLLSMRRIVDECFSDMKNFHCQSYEEFWKINKYFLNYVNAVYSIRCFLNHYQDQVFCYVLNPVYNSYSFYRLLLEVRNFAIHDSLLIKDYLNRNFSACLRYEDLIKAATKSKRKTNKRKYTDSCANESSFDYDLSQHLDSISKNYPFIVKSDPKTGQNLLMIIPWLDFTHNQIQDVLNEAIDSIYNKKIVNIWSRLLDIYISYRNGQIIEGIEETSIKQDIYSFYEAVLDLSKNQEYSTAHCVEKLLNDKIAQNT